MEKRPTNEREGIEWNKKTLSFRKNLMLAMLALAALSLYTIYRVSYWLPIGAWRGFDVPSLETISIVSAMLLAASSFYLGYQYHAWGVNMVKERETMWADERARIREEVKAELAKGEAA